MSIALCKCGVDIVEHDKIYKDNGAPLQPFRHEFEASGTRHRCEKIYGVTVKLQVTPDDEVVGKPVNEVLICPRPKGHDDVDGGAPCGPLTGDIL